MGGMFTFVPYPMTNASKPKLHIIPYGQGAEVELSTMHLRKQAELDFAQVRRATSSPSASPPLPAHRGPGRRIPALLCRHHHSVPPLMTWRRAWTSQTPDRHSQTGGSGVALVAEGTTAAPSIKAQTSKSTESSHSAATRPRLRCAANTGTLQSVALRKLPASGADTPAGTTSRLEHSVQVSVHYNKDAASQPAWPAHRVRAGSQGSVCQCL